ncbi:MarR family winged helix-turn-helix transcriptional regulator [Streptomyces sp. Je 1-332]|uniref:MarR family winged helix-turn-helix transcriptional regulator n=1 Tax=Streptomyces sp. Je 1-332 TaxID=3231270 RepID=UPI0034597238
MTYLLDDLEAHTLVTRKPDPRDRRARQVLITDTGQPTSCSGTVTSRVTGSMPSARTASASLSVRTPARTW